MRKVLIAFLLVAVLLMAMVSPALAYGGDPDEGHIHRMMYGYLRKHTMLVVKLPQASAQNGTT